jgi:hypothetical protein
MEVGKKWKGKTVSFVSFERWKGQWWIAYSHFPWCGVDLSRRRPEGEH